MPLTCVNISNFRNFSWTELNFNQSCNVFYGQNGSGKTSLLEAIYYLILGRSFRSHLLRRIIKYGETSFSLFGKIQQEDNLTSVGITKSTEFGKRIKVDGNNIPSNLEITKLLPLQLLNHNSYLLLSEGPKLRRQFIDWGLFHVEQSFLDLWRRTERILEQRNSALRNKSPIDCVKIWDKDLAQLGTVLHNYRKQYVESFIVVAQEVLQKLSCDFSINISYYAGWDTNLDLYTVLTNTLKADYQLGYTSVGPHRADLQITIGKIPAKDALSRGQQKLLLYALQIAHGILLHQLTNKKCIYLIDDLPAELDNHKCGQLANMLASLKSQIFITGLTRDSLESILIGNDQDKTTFYLDNGIIEVQP